MKANGEKKDYLGEKQSANEIQDKRTEYHHWQRKDNINEQNNITNKQELIGKDKYNFKSRFFNSK